MGLNADERIMRRGPGQRETCRGPDPRSWTARHNELIFEFVGALNDVRLDRKLTPHVTKQPEDEDENKNCGYAAAAKFPGGCAR